MPKYEMAETMDDISGRVLETFIVGRKFSDDVELNHGKSITLLRDPDNIKYCNAIKVLSADSGCFKVLGFLPRQLAQYLSPLMDNYCLSFEGCITSVPKHSLDVVPIQIICQNEIFVGEKEYDGIQVVKSLWKNAFHVAESAKSHPPSMTKYQQNFSPLIQEVLRSYPHLLNYDGKIFLETLTSLSDDSQRLFVRLYTRKGPWFRISNIFYPEISDCKQAFKELSAMGYIRSVGSISDLQDNDLKEVLNVLTVSELREILCKLKKGMSSSAFTLFQGKNTSRMPIPMFRIGLSILIPPTCQHLSSLIWMVESWVRIGFHGSIKSMVAGPLWTLVLLAQPRPS